MSVCPACGGSPRPWRPGIEVCARCGSAVRGWVPDARERQTHYSGYHEEAPGLSPLTRDRLAAWAEALLPHRRLGRLLEVGCGVGHFLEAARAVGFDAWGTEVSSSGLQKLRERGLHALPGELPDLGLPVAHFDAVVLFEVIEHLPDPSRYLSECHRVLREGGVLLLTTPNFDSLSRRLLGERWRVVDPEHLVLFTSRGLRVALERAHFRVRDLSSRNLDPTEVLRGLRREPPRPTAERQAEIDACRSALAGRPGLRTVKAAANAVLRWLSAGDTLEAWAGR